MVRSLRERGASIVAGMMVLTLCAILLLDWPIYFSGIFTNPVVDAYKFLGQAGGNPCYAIQLAAATITGPPANTTWVDARRFGQQQTWACGTYTLYIPHAHIMFNCSTWTFDVGVYVGPSETFDAPVNGDNNCVVFKDTASFPGSGAVTVNTWTNGSGTLSVNKASGENTFLEIGDYLIIPADSTVTQFVTGSSTKTGIYRVTAGVTLTSGGTAISVSVTPNLGATSVSSGSAVTVVHGVLNLGGASANGFAGPAPGMVVTGIAVTCSTAHPQIGIKAIYAQDNSRLVGVNTTNCGPRDGQLGNQTNDSIYGPIYSVHSSSSSYMCDPSGWGWEIWGQGGSNVVWITDVANACSSAGAAPWFGIDYEGSVPPTNGAGPHRVSAHVEGFHDAHAIGWWSQTNGVILDTATGCPHNGTGYPDGYDCVNGVHIFSASTGASGLASNSTGNILILNWYKNAGIGNCGILDDLRGSTCNTDTFVDSRDEGPGGNQFWCPNCQTDAVGLFTWGGATGSAALASGSSNNFEQWTLPVEVTFTQFDMVLATAASGCTTYPTMSLYDSTASSALLSIAMTSGTTNYNVTGSAQVAAGHVIRWRTTVAGSGCSTAPLNAGLTATYHF